MNKAAVLEYLNATKGVEGWFFPIDAFLFAMADEVQKREGIRGNLFEIGVHHGKTALFLSRMSEPGELLGVCDVFEQQELNRDRSGEGSRELFLRSMRECGGRDDVRVFAKLSSALTPEETTTQCRFVHIDGGHRPEDVINDLHVADRALLPDGVVAVDDVFNPSWPGVSEGFYEFLRGGAFVPVVIGGNKVLLTRPAAAERYERHWQDLDEWRNFIAPQPFSFEWKGWMGRPVLTAARQTWVDLDPAGAARRHLGEPQ
ncbi:MAG TPA: class I SAM-dependent methyltransferase [Thermoanaerobaculia bacterium]|nr:class I SAM-dependent methyltransferase [Thermoanaerobaculia bacterium]